MENSEINQYTEKEQIEHYLRSFTDLANYFFERDEKEAYNYWKGQVMGMAKIVDLIGLDIDTKYWLNSMP